MNSYFEIVVVVLLLCSFLVLLAVFRILSLIENINKKLTKRNKDN